MWKDYVWNPTTFDCENWKYLASIMDDSMITCDEVIKSYEEKIKTISTNFNENKVISGTQNVCILHAFFLIIIA